MNIIQNQSLLFLLSKIFMKIGKYFIIVGISSSESNNCQSRNSGKTLFGLNLCLYRLGPWILVLVLNVHIELFMLRTTDFYIVFIKCFPRK